MANLFEHIKSKKNKVKDDKKVNETSKNTFQEVSLKKSLQDNMSLFKDNILKNDNTIIYRQIKNKHSHLEFCLIFVDGMINNEIINENIIYELAYSSLENKSKDLVEYLQEKVIIINEVNKTNEINKMINSLLYGDTILLIDGYDEALILNTKGWQTRSISEPQSETIVKGPREGFNESLLMNISMIRRRIISPDLKFEYKQIGTRTKTKVCIAYVDGIVNPKILEELKQRLDKIDMEGFFSGGTIEEIISDSPLSPFKTIGNTERPDVVASKLLQGRIAVLSDGSPTVLTLPYLFVEYFQINEDYYDSFIYASLNRLLRIMAFILTISAPALYVALTMFHKELIPTKILFSIYLAEEGVATPTALEAIVMLITFEIIREAGLRLPKHVGGAVSIVGALILGDAAANAKFVSAPIIIVIALSGICELILHEMRAGVLVVRFIFLILSSFLGIYGFVFSAMGLIIHLVSIKSFGIPYMLKLIDLDKYDIRDTSIRAPWWLLKYRTKFIAKDRVRSKNYVNRGKNNEKKYE